MDPHGAPFLCSVINWSDCGALHRSQFALVAGAPVAWFGFLFYCWVSMVVGWLIRKRESSPIVMKILFQFSYLALLFNCYQLFVMAFKLQTFCLICVLMFIVNLGIFWLIATIHRNGFVSQMLTGFSASLTLHYVFIVLLFAAGYWMIRSVVPFTQKHAATAEAPVGCAATATRQRLVD